MAFMKQQSSLCYDNIFSEPAEPFTPPMIHCVQIIQLITVLNIAILQTKAIQPIQEPVEEPSGQMSFLSKSHISKIAFSLHQDWLALKYLIMFSP